MLKKKGLKREKEMAANMISNWARWLVDGVVDLKITNFNQQLCKKSNMGAILLKMKEIKKLSENKIKS